MLLEEGKRDKGGAGEETGEQSRGGTGRDKKIKVTMKEREEEADRRHGGGAVGRYLNIREEACAADLVVTDGERAAVMIAERRRRSNKTRAVDDEHDDGHDDRASV